MVVLARPRQPGGGHVRLEDDDVIEHVLEKPFGEVLGCTLDPSSLQRSLSARVRRRERVGDDVVQRRSPEVLRDLRLTRASLPPPGEISGPVWRHDPHAARHDARLPPPAGARPRPRHPAQAV